MADCYTEPQSCELFLRPSSHFANLSDANPSLSWYVSLRSRLHPDAVSIFDLIRVIQLSFLLFSFNLVKPKRGLARTRKQAHATSAYRSSEKRRKPRHSAQLAGGREKENVARASGCYRMISLLCFSVEKQAEQTAREVQKRREKEENKS